jgi:3-deoxy-D-manno-octulosonic-acid transferase
MAEKMFYTPFRKKIKPTDQTIWFHAASLGNEQGLPVEK